MTDKSHYGNLFKSIANKELIAHKLDVLFRQGKIPEDLHVENKRHGSLDDFYFHPSTHCKPDARQLYFMLHPDHRPDLVQRKKQMVDVLTPYYGTIAHAVIQQTMISQGMISPDDIEVSLTNDAYNWTGHMDLIYQGIPVDIKTMNPRKFKWLEENGVEEQYKQQLNCYLDMYPDAPYGILLAQEMSYPFRIKEKKIERDPQMLRAVYDKWDYVQERIAMDEPPRELCCSGFKGVAYDRCPARFICKEMVIGVEK